jgi:hypothetical protein
VGLVVAPNQEMAERRFFESWSADASLPLAAAAPPPATHAPASHHDVMGLFPEPQSRP